MLFTYALTSKASLRHALDYALALAGRKVMQEGFCGLGEWMRERINESVVKSMYPITLFARGTPVEKT
jgi:hypothetical protein